MEDESEYKRSVRNTSVILVIIILVIALSLAVPPVINPRHEEFNSFAKQETGYGFSLNLRLSSSILASGKNLTIQAWIENDRGQIRNLTSGSSWLFTAGIYTSCLPIGVGIAKGYFDDYNISLATPLGTPYSSVSEVCQETEYYILIPGTTYIMRQASNGLEKINASLSISLSGYYSSGRLVSFNGVYTVFALDEWGDSVLAHFKAG